jgi:acetoin utilization deacetylase AcuC-like enzyme
VQIEHCTNGISLVAAGFDAAAGDELGGCFVTPPCYAHMTHMLMTLAGGKVAVCLEVSSACLYKRSDLRETRADIISDQSPNLLWQLPEH